MNGDRQDYGHFGKDYGRFEEHCGVDSVTRHGWTWEACNSHREEHGGLGQKGYDLRWEGRGSLYEEGSGDLEEEREVQGREDGPLLWLPRQTAEQTRAGFWFMSILSGRRVNKAEKWANKHDKGSKNNEKKEVIYREETCSGGIQNKKQGDKC